MKFLNRDLELRDESGEFIPISGSVTYAVIYGYHYRSDGTTETDLYAYMQSLMNQTGCTYTWKDLSGTQPVSASYFQKEKGGKRKLLTAMTAMVYSFLK